MLPRLRHQVQAAVQDRLQVALQHRQPPYVPAPRKFCTTVTDTECRVTVKTGTKTVYEQQCSTVYQEKCSGHGYKQTCAPAPTQKCQQVRA